MGSAYVLSWNFLLYTNRIGSYSWSNY